MEDKKPDFSFGPTESSNPDEPDAALRELSLLPDSPKKKKVLTGYDPYDRDANVTTKEPAPANRADLRKLSEWIKLKKEVETLKNEPPPELPPRDRD
jgi:hypothetical protein